MTNDVITMQDTITILNSRLRDLERAAMGANDPASCGWLIIETMQIQDAARYATRVARSERSLAAHALRMDEALGEIDRAAFYAVNRALNR